MDTFTQRSPTDRRHCGIGQWLAGKVVFTHLYHQAMINLLIVNVFIQELVISGYFIFV